MTKGTKIIRSLIVAGTALTAFTALPARAEDGPRSSEVNVRQYDLTTEAGVNALHHRLKAAAYSVCTTGGSDLSSIGEEKACFSKAMKSAELRLSRMVAQARTNDRTASNGPTVTAAR